MNGNGFVVAVLVIGAAFGAFYIIWTRMMCTNCDRPGLRKSEVNKTYDYGRAQQAAFECSYCGFKEWKTVSVIDEWEPVISMVTGIEILWRELRDPRKRTKLWSEVIDAVRTGRPESRRESRESLRTPKPMVEEKGKVAGHPTLTAMKPLPAWPETQPEGHKEERPAARAEAPAGETTPEIRKPERSEPPWLGDAGDVRRAIIWTEILRRPHPRGPRGRHR